MAQRMTARRWFWVLLSGAAAWSAFSVGVPSLSTNGPAQLSRDLAMTTLTPLAYPLRNWLQQPVYEFLHPKYVDKMQKALLEQKDISDNEIAILRTRVEQLQQQLDQIVGARKRFHTELMPASIVGVAGTDARTCVIDRGYLDLNRFGPFNPGQKLVVLSNVAPLGYVITSAIGPTTSEVRLLTDPSIRIQARLIRQTKPGQDVIVARDCLVYGNGGPLLTCDTVSKGTLPPERGDFVELDDNEWPAELAGAVLGTVESVETSPSNSQRWLLRIEPRVTVESSRQVSISLPSK